MIYGVLGSTVTDYSPNIWIPVILAFLGLCTAIVKLLTDSASTTKQLENIHVLVNSNLVTAVNEIARLRAILDNQNIVHNIPEVKNPLESKGDDS